MEESDQTSDLQISSLAIDDGIRFASQSGQKISIKKSLIDQKIPYFETLFRLENEAGFLPSTKNENGEYILPVEIIDIRYLQSILAYLENDNPAYLLTKLSIECDILDLLQVFDFLLIDKPDIDLDSYKKRMRISKPKPRQMAVQAAGEIFIGLAMGFFEDMSTKTDHRRIMFKRMEFIFSHLSSFRPNVRHHVVKVFQNFNDTHSTFWTENENKIFNDWMDKCPFRVRLIDQIFDKDEDEKIRRRSEMVGKKYGKKKSTGQYDLDLFGHIVQNY